jgi:hypothetical protein
LTGLCVNILGGNAMARRAFQGIGETNGSILTRRPSGFDPLSSLFGSGIVHERLFDCFFDDRHRRNG